MRLFNFSMCDYKLRSNKLKNKMFLKCGLFAQSVNIKISILKILTSCFYCILHAENPEKLNEMYIYALASYYIEKLHK